MASARKSEDVNERIVQKLGRICIVDANRLKVARFLGVDNGTVSSALKRKKA